MKDVGRRGNRGFTLVEVLVAMAILAVGILGATLLFPIALRFTQVASGKTVASTYADTTVDRLRAQGYTGLGADEQTTRRGEDGFTLDRLRAADLLYDGTDTTLRRTASSLQLYEVVITVPLKVGPKEQFITFIARQ